MKSFGRTSSGQNNGGSGTGGKLLSTVIYGTANNDALSGSASEPNYIVGLAGNDKINGGNLNDTIYGDDEGGTEGSGNGNDTIGAAGGDDIVLGGGGNDVIDGDFIYLGGKTWSASGAAGNDLLNGGTGNDTILGGGGRDTLIGGQGNDLLSGGTSRIGEGDTVDYSAAPGGVIVDLYYGLAKQDGYGTTDILQDIENVIGSQFDDDIGGNNANNLLIGHAGNDTVFGYDGNDTLYGGAGIDYLVGDAGNDFIYGGEDEDTLVGNQGNDYLSGEGGNDHLAGGQGNNTLSGGSGKDEFEYSVRAPHVGGVDTILDLEAGEILHLSFNAAANAGHAVELADGSLLMDMNTGPDYRMVFSGHSIYFSKLENNNETVIKTIHTNMDVSDYSWWESSSTLKLSFEF